MITRLPSDVTGFPTVCGELSGAWSAPKIGPRLLGAAELTGASLDEVVVAEVAEPEVSTITSLLFVGVEVTMVALGIVVAVAV